jgi:hypothetical protein
MSERANDNALGSYPEFEATFRAAIRAAGGVGEEFYCDYPCVLTEFYSLLSLKAVAMARQPLPAGSDCVHIFPECAQSDPTGSKG